MIPLLVSFRLKVLLSFLFVLSLAATAEPSPPGPTFGRYVGVLKHDNQGREQLAKLDFIFTRGNQNVMQLKAILTLHFGDFASGEYLSYHYDNVRYNLVSSALSFEDADQPLSIQVSRFSGDTLVGQVSSIWSGNVGQITLVRGDIVSRSFPIVEPLWGQYEGRCGRYNTPARLLIYTFRSTEDLAHLAQPFGAYSVASNLLIGCQDGQCINFDYARGSYDFFAAKDQLSLIGSRSTLACNKNGGTIECHEVSGSEDAGAYSLANCSFQRNTAYESQPLTLSPVVKPGGFTPPSPESSIGALTSGEYRGYVFHEYRGLYQPAALNVRIFQGGGDSGTRIASNARLFFGSFSSREVTPYQFAERDYPNPSLGAKQLLLSRAAQDVDGLINISEIRDGVIRGTWYSLLFGRVGPVVLQKEGLPALPPGARIMERLSGYYEGPKEFFAGSLTSWVIRVQVVPGTKPPNTNSNPFFPNLIRGSMYFEPILPRLGILDGSYDIYTGRFAFTEAKYESLSGSSPLSGPDHFWIGTQTSQTEMQLHHWIGAALTPRLQQRAQTFRLKQEAR